GAGPAGGRQVPHPRYERPHTLRAVPLISGHQRPAAAGDNTPPDHLRTGARHHAHSSWPSPGPPGTTNKVTGCGPWAVSPCPSHGSRRRWGSPGTPPTAQS
ncbi:hypothetical protein F4W10_12315, partial [Actinomyces johnsonii]